MGLIRKQDVSFGQYGWSRCILSCCLLYFVKVHYKNYLQIYKKAIFGKKKRWIFPPIPKGKKIKSSYFTENKPNTSETKVVRRKQPLWLFNKGSYSGGSDWLGSLRLHIFIFKLLKWTFLIQNALWIIFISYGNDSVTLESVCPNRLSAYRSTNREVKLGRSFVHLPKKFNLD